MIELKDVRKVYNAGKPNEYAALQGITLAIESGKATAFKGPSGSGKTTLLSIVGCMSRPTSGRLWVEGREVTSLPERFLTEIRRKAFGFIFQQFHLIRGITALENAMLPAYPTGLPYGEIKARALRLFEELEIAGRASLGVEWLSGGEAQRVAIARALINDPGVLIADEPTAHLDSRLSAELMGIFASLKAQGKTLLVASHDPLVCESGAVDRVVEVRDGRII